MIGSAKPGPAQPLTGTCVGCESAQRTIEKQAQQLQEKDQQIAQMQVGKYGINHLNERNREQARRIENAEAHRDGLYRMMQALAEDDRPRLSAVDERIQADVDAIVVERISNRERIAELKVESESRFDCHWEAQGVPRCRGCASCLHEEIAELERQNKRLKGGIVEARSDLNADVIPKEVWKRLGDALRSQSVPKPTPEDTDD